MNFLFSSPILLTHMHVLLESVQLLKLDLCSKSLFLCVSDDMIQLMLLFLLKIEQIRLNMQSFVVVCPGLCKIMYPTKFKTIIGKLVFTCNDLVNDLPGTKSTFL